MEVHLPKWKNWCKATSIWSVFCCFQCLNTQKKVPSAWLRKEHHFLYGTAPGPSPGTSVGIGPSTHRSSLQVWNKQKKIKTKKKGEIFRHRFRLHCSSCFNHGGVFTSVKLRVLGNLYGVVGRKDPTSTSAHVVALVPVILWLHLHQQRIVHLQLQLVIVSRDKPEDKEVLWLYRLIMG